MAVVKVNVVIVVLLEKKIEYAVMHLHIWPKLFSETVLYCKSKYKINPDSKPLGVKVRAQGPNGDLNW